MGVIRSILLLAGVVCSVAFAYAIGHALSTGHMKPVIVGLALLAIGVVLLTIYHKSGPVDGAITSQH